MIIKRRIAPWPLLVLVAGFLPDHTFAQARQADIALPSGELLASWIALDAPTGHEHLATERLGASLKGWRTDRSGNLIKTVGTGPVTDLVACLMDAPSFTISEIREDGYLRLHDIGRGGSHPLWAQMHEGQQLRVLTRQGPVLGVTALENNHFRNLHLDEQKLARTDDLWLDAGAASAAEVRKMGIELLDPVLRHLPPWHFEGWVAGPAAGARLGCALVVAAAESNIQGAGATRFVLSAQSAFRGVGLSAAAAELSSVKRVTVLGPGREASTDSVQIISPLSAAFDVSVLETLHPEVQDAGALMERVHVREAGRLAAELLARLDADGAIARWLPAPPRAPVRNRDAAWMASLGGAPELAAFARSLRELASRYAVAGHETPVREAVFAALPRWAKDIAETDELGNLWIALGPAEADATVFMAHMDEVGWRVADIDANGVVELERRGGTVSLAWEGQPALLHLSAETGLEAAADPGMLRGVFLPRQAPETRRPEAMRAWFGLDKPALEAAGVSNGMPVTGYKEAHRLGPSRFTARGMDDRVGTAALLKVVQRMDPGRLEHRVVLAWTVREEIGLHGARALARRFGPRTKRVYSIDTFVTSDTPLESPHFAHAPLGAGPVLRSMESSGMVRRQELDRNRAIAARAAIDVQVGMTQGGTDGTAFTFFGAPNAGLSWPGRYSHGPAELGDLRDMLDLVALIEAFVFSEP
ncbi:MAG: M28 family peptidase [Halieaceae bacterium]|jgi:putative aminopeptidase FrvX|nr:M28 family peptidase [Halieaceae bacterium]